MVLLWVLPYSQCHTVAPDCCTCIHECKFLTAHTTRSHSDLVLQLLEAGNPDYMTNMRSGRTIYPTTGKRNQTFEAVSWRSKPGDAAPPAALSSVTTVSTPWEMAGPGKENISLSVCSQHCLSQHKKEYKMPTVYWALKQYLASREKPQQTVRDWRTWRIRQWKQTETSWQHTPN